jgi:hypothetical protein
MATKPGGKPAKFPSSSAGRKFDSVSKGRAGISPSSTSRKPPRGTDDPGGSGQQQQQQQGGQQQQQQQGGQQQQQQPGQQQQQQAGQQQQQQQQGANQQQQQTVNVNDLPPGATDLLPKGSWGWGWWQWSSLPSVGSGGGIPAINVMSPPAASAPVVEAPDLAGAIQELGRLQPRPRRSEQTSDNQNTTTTTPEQERQRAKMEDLRRSLNPPAHEIESALALNTLLDDLHGFQALGGHGPPVSLDADLLRHINVIWKQDTGNIGLLKNEGRLAWPVALQGAEYHEAREALNALTPKGIKESMRGSVDAETLAEMKSALGSLKSQLAGNIDKLSAPQHIEAKRFLGRMDDALKVLAQPHAGNYFSGKFAAQGKTVGDLVEHMTKHSLKFAPAVPGDESAYVDLHKALAAYDVAAHYSKMGKP